jgi:hypothetical protein
MASETAVAVPETTAHVKTDEEFEEDFEKWRTEELAHQDKLNACCFGMGGLLVEWNAMGDPKKLRYLAGKYGYKVSTLVQRGRAWLEIPPEHRNPNLSFGCHLEVLKIARPPESESTPEAEAAIDAARWALLDGAPFGTTIESMRVMVHKRRQQPDLKQLQPRGLDLFGDDEDGEDGDPHGRERGGKRYREAALRERMAKLSNAGGFDISDGISGIVKVRGQYIDGEVVLTVDDTAEFEADQLPVLTIRQGSLRNFTVNFAVAMPLWIPAGGSFRASASPRCSRSPGPTSASAAEIATSSARAGASRSTAPLWPRGSGLACRRSGTGGGGSMSRSRQRSCGSCQDWWPSSASQVTSGPRHGTCPSWTGGPGGTRLGCSRPGNSRAAPTTATGGTCTTTRPRVTPAGTRRGSTTATSAAAGPSCPLSAAGAAGTRLICDAARQRANPAGRPTGATWRRTSRSARPKGRPARPGRSPPAGRAGHARHKRRHETPCNPCQAARREYDRDWEAKRRIFSASGHEIACRADSMAA